MISNILFFCFQAVYTNTPNTDTVNNKYIKENSGTNPTNFSCNATSD